MSAASARAEAADRKSAARRRRWTWLRRLWGLSTGRFGLIVVAVVSSTAIVARFWTPFDPRQVDDREPLGPARLAAPARHGRRRDATS